MLVYQRVFGKDKRHIRRGLRRLRPEDAGDLSELLERARTGLWRKRGIYGSNKTLDFLKLWVYNTVCIVCVYQIIYINTYIYICNYEHTLWNLMKLLYFAWSHSAKYISDKIGSKKLLVYAETTSPEPQWSPWSVLAIFGNLVQFLITPLLPWWCPKSPQSF